jgi:hypothetical protein
MPNLQPRDASPSPSLRDRPRALKTQSMPMVPSIAALAAQQQASPTVPTSTNRRSPPIGQVTRLLPTPPQPNPPAFQDIPERRMSPSFPPQQSLSQSSVNSHYARPVPRVPTAPFLNKFQNIDENWQMTAELLADIERADKQQAQYLSAQCHPYPSARGESPSPRSLNVERVRGLTDRSSPNNPDSQRRPREQAIARESPKVRDRQPASPLVASFTQGQLRSVTPEGRMTPAQHSPLVLSSEAHSTSYLGPYNTRESPPLRRRSGNNEIRQNASMASQTPPLQAIPARTSDRSLPVQEEAEDEISSKDGTGSHENWQDKEQIVEQQFHSPSPPPPDMNSEGNAQRYDSTIRGRETGPGPREDEKLNKHEEIPAKFGESTSEEGGYTPRSPPAGLPEEGHVQPYFSQNVSNRVPVPVPMRGKARNGSTDQVMRGLESTLFEKQPPAPQLPQNPAQTEHLPKYVKQRRPSETEPLPPAHQHQHYSPQPEYIYDNQNSPFPPPQVYPDDFQSYGEDLTSAYIQSYLQSSRPDAPVPPTPHSQTAPPSPSPLISGYGAGKQYRPMRAGGSPYPFPFGHVRRNRQSQRYFPGNFDPNHPSVISEQVARQWQIFAQNNHGDMTDSTLSPSSTPFQGELYDQWAYVHTNRMMRGLQDPTSLQSSPSHHPISLPIPPSFPGRKKERNLQSKRQAYNRKPPPRVESTQPRETSPDLSSSGEETAGEERLIVPIDSTESEAITIPILPIQNTEIDDNGEWVDEEDDYEDLISLEYHPSFVKNISKRRRKWEVGWENLIQAVSSHLNL